MKRTVTTNEKVRSRREARRREVVALRSRVSNILQPLRKTQTLQAIADEIGDGCQPIAVSQYIERTQTPSAKRLTQVAKLGNVSFNWLITGRGPKR